MDDLQSSALPLGEGAVVRNDCQNLIGRARKQQESNPARLELARQGLDLPLTLLARRGIALGIHR